ncbi:MAG: hypothetical protein NVSMB46_08890 [Candidatus Saccharimonadales bacterium]
MEIEKNSYINTYSTALRCRGGKIPMERAEMDESSDFSYSHELIITNDHTGLEPNNTLEFLDKQ